MHGTDATLNLINCFAGGVPAPADGDTRVPNEALLKWGGTGATTGHVLNMTNCIFDATNYPYAFNTTDAPTVGSFANNCFQNVGLITFFRDGGVTTDKTAAQFITQYSATNSVTTDPQVSADFNYRVAQTSPCVDTGDTSVRPLTDFNGVAFDTPINMGAYNTTAGPGTITAGKSSIATVTSTIA